LELSRKRKTILDFGFWVAIYGVFKIEMCLFSADPNNKHKATKSRRLYGFKIKYIVPCAFVTSWLSGWALSAYPDTSHKDTKPRRMEGFTITFCAFVPL
jgi:hypothetical protein